MALKTRREPEPVPEDGFAAAAEVRLREDHAIFRELMQRLSYYDFDHIPVAEFQAFAILAMLDLWSDYDEPKKAERSAKREVDLPAMRAAPEYREVHHNLQELWSDMKLPKSLSEYMMDPKIQDRTARETMRIAFHGNELTERNRALREMLDRQMPREMIVQQKGTFLITEAHLARLEIVEIESRRLLPDAVVVDEEGEAPDASRRPLEETVRDDPEPTA